MPHFICTTCGAQYAESEKPSERCAICIEERQYVPPHGQTWTTLEELRLTHMNAFHQYEEGLIGIGTQPTFAIGQRALLVRTRAGNILWDCISFIDAATVTLVEALGGIKALAISHPHFYTGMIEWSRAFGGAPIYLHAADREWIMRPDPAIRLWEGETQDPLPGATLVRCGGHFAGGTVLHWADGASGRGVLCSGDILTVTTDRKYLTFMRSYPNLIPLSAREVDAIAAALAPFSFERIYGHYFDRVISRDARAVLDASVDRYKAAIAGTRGY